jgi:hypothetical protein
MTKPSARAIVLWTVRAGMQAVLSRVAARLQQVTRRRFT